VTRLVLTYSGPVEAAEVVREVAGTRFDIRTVPPEIDAVASGLKSASAFLDASMKVRLTEAMIAAAPELRVVVTATTGADHIDADALARRGIPLLTLKGQREILSDLTPAAEHSWLLLMACARRLPSAHNHVMAGGWSRTDFPGTMLKGKALGIVGCGRLGRWMARYGDAFGMRCRGYDPYLHAWPPGIERVELRELLASSDFITLHVHLTPDNRGLLGRAEFAQMKRGCIFVNTSRGELIDEAALLEGLESERIGAAGLDVLTGEPDVAEHPLRRYALTRDNLIITPHIAGYSPDAVRVVVRFSAGRIVDFFGAAR
jgi:phosphoglycerate dehydrogenase-like enzyme